MRKIKMKYYIMIHPSGKFLQVFAKQIKKIAQEIYKGKDNQAQVIYRVLTVKKQTNPRKLFIQGDEKVIEFKISPHITLTPKIEIKEENETQLISKIRQAVQGISPFSLKPKRIDDYGEDFTLFVAFGASKKIEVLKSKLTRALKKFFSLQKELRDILHATLLYDDTNKDYVAKAKSLIDQDSLLKEEFIVDAVWLWKNKPSWQPYKKFLLKR